MQLISDKQWLAGIRDIIELHKYGRADEVRTVHRLASTCEERYQKALEYLEEKRGQQGEPAGAREGRRTAGGTCWSKQGGRRREDGRGNLLEQGGRKERGRQGDLVFTTFGSAEGGHARKYSNKFGISLTYP